MLNFFTIDPEIYKYNVKEEEYFEILQNILIQLKNYQSIRILFTEAVKEEILKYITDIGRTDLRQSTKLKWIFNECVNTPKATILKDQALQKKKCDALITNKKKEEKIELFSITIKDSNKIDEFVDKFEKIHKKGLLLRTMNESEISEILSKAFIYSKKINLIYKPGGFWTYFFYLNNKEKLFRFHSPANKKAWEIVTEHQRGLNFFFNLLNKNSVYEKKEITIKAHVQEKYKNYDNYKYQDDDNSYKQLPFNSLEEFKDIIEKKIKDLLNLEYDYKIDLTFDFDEGARYLKTDQVSAELKPGSDIFEFKGKWVIKRNACIDFRAESHE